MSFPHALVLGVFALALGAGSAQAQIEHRIPARVTAVSGQAVFLDRGRESRFEPGDRVILHPPAGIAIVARLTVVSRTSSRAELAPGSRVPDIGTDAEVLVPAARFTDLSVPPAEAQPDAPAHPPWQAPLPNVDEGVPLLAPVERIRRDERPTKWTGRLFSRMDYSTSDGESYSLAEAGLETTVENAFGDGGTLHFRGLVNTSPVPVFDGSNENESDARIERFSYRSNDAAEEPLRGAEHDPGRERHRRR